MQQRNTAVIVISLAFVFLIVNPVYSQGDSDTLGWERADTMPVIDYAQEHELEIGGIRVSGTEYSEESALIGVSGLKVGDVIEIPGRAIPDAIRNLYRLSLFANVQIVATHIEDDVVFLEIQVKERPRYLAHTFRGVREGQHDDLTKVVERHIRRNSILTENAKRNLVRGLEEHFIEKGYLDAEVTLREEPFPKRPNSVRIIFDIDRKKRVKIGEITFHNNASTDLPHVNKKLKDRKLRRQLKETKKKGRIFGKSKFVVSDYEDDKKALIQYYNSLGLRDAKIVKDTVYQREDGKLAIEMTMSEGRQYYYRKIDWVGNTIYPDATLSTVLGIKKGDVYNPELMEKQLRFSEDSRDVSSLYMDEGYLFFNVAPDEVSVDDDSVDLIMQIYEGPQATIDKVVINGNDRTHEHVIRRVLRTKPGEKFSRTNLLRSQREIINLGYFNPEEMGIETPVNQNQGTVDIIYDLVEQPSDQLELSAGYNGAAGILGTVGVTFNNFSSRRIFEKGAWRPVPMGDGQKLSIRGQASGNFYQSINFSFTEPWLGGKKPNSLTVGAFYTKNGLSGLASKTSPYYADLTSLAGYVGLGKQLKWPDDYFFFNGNIYFQNYSLRQNVASAEASNVVVFRHEGRPIHRGSFNNYYLSLTIGRSSINEPLFPTRGSKFSLNLSVTPPYSWFKDDDFYKIDEEEAAELIGEENARRRFYGLNDMNENETSSLLFSEESAKRFNYLEYHKWRFDAEWYTQLVGKLVLRSSAKLGYIGQWNKNVGVGPFERYQLGGDGLNNQYSGIQGIDLIRLRGYEIEDVSDRNGDGRSNDSEYAKIFNKYELELRYPISTNPNSTIFILSFLEAGNSWLNYSDYQPFNLRRSAGFGLRVFLPVFGLIGFDYGWGFDKPNLIASGAGAGQYAKFGLVIGFEPD